MFEHPAELPRPDIYSFVAVIAALAKAPDSPQTAKELARRAPRKLSNLVGLAQGSESELQPVCSKRFATLMGQLGVLEERLVRSSMPGVKLAEELFKEIHPEERNTRVYNALLAGYERRGMGDKALKLLRGMQEIEDFESGIGGSGIGGEQERTDDVVFESDNVAGTGTVSSNSVAGKPDSDAGLDTTSVKPDIVTYSLVISALSKGQEGVAASALELLSEMQRKYSIRPDTNLLNAVLTALERAGDWKMAVALFTQMASVPDRGGCKPTIVSLNAVISACARAGEIRILLDLVKSAKKLYSLQPNLVTYSAAIMGCEKAGLWREAEEFGVKRRALAALVGLSRAQRASKGQAGAGASDIRKPEDKDSESKVKSSITAPIPSYDMATVTEVLQELVRVAGDGNATGKSQDTATSDKRKALNGAAAMQLISKCQGGGAGAGATPLFTGVPADIGERIQRMRTITPSSAADNGHFSVRKTGYEYELKSQSRDINGNPFPVTVASCFQDPSQHLRRFPPGSGTPEAVLRDFPLKLLEEVAAAAKAKDGTKPKPSCMKNSTSKVTGESGHGAAATATPTTASRSPHVHNFSVVDVIACAVVMPDHIAPESPPQSGPAWSESPISTGTSSTIESESQCHVHTPNSRPLFLVSLSKCSESVFPKGTFYDNFKILRAVADSTAFGELKESVGRGPGGLDEGYDLLVIRSGSGGFHAEQVLGAYLEREIWNTRTSEFEPECAPVPSFNASDISGPPSSPGPPKLRDHLRHGFIACSHPPCLCCSLNLSFSKAEKAIPVYHAVKLNLKLARAGDSESDRDSDLESIRSVGRNINRAGYNFDVEKVQWEVIGKESTSRL